MGLMVLLIINFITKIHLCILQMRELEKSDKNSKSLLANVLDTEGDYILAPGGKPLPPDVHVHCPEETQHISGDQMPLIEFFVA